MTCSAEPPLTPEEERAKAAQAILIDGKDVFKTMSYELGNRTVYHQRSERFLFYEEPKGMWKIGESCVFGKPSLFTSRPTDVYSPDLALWIDEAHGGKMAVVGLNDDDVPKGFKFGLKVRAVEDGWKDPDFPHNNDSIGAAASKYKGNRWLRAVSLHPHPALFADVEPADACQGTVGNCWLVAALSALAEFPSYIKNNLFVTKKISQSGKYQVKLFDGRSNRWEIIEIDDYLPCTGSGGDQPDLLFANIPDGKMCIALLEKACAKIYFSYGGVALISILIGMASNLIAMASNLEVMASNLIARCALRSLKRPLPKCMVIGLLWTPAFQRSPGFTRPAAKKSSTTARHTLQQLRSGW